METGAPSLRERPGRSRTSPADAGPLSSPSMRSRDRLCGWLHPFRAAITVYLATRLLLLVVALLDAFARHHLLMHVLAHWDGQWYRDVAVYGYPAHVVHGRSTLGFFPLYPMVVWPFGQLVHLLPGVSLPWAMTVAGVGVSLVGGLAATLLVQVLASGWWGPDSGRRAAMFFALFPGSVVFSMVYAEGLMLPLAAGCLLALERRRWLLGGALAGLATAAEPEAVILILVCAACALRELRRSGWRARGTGRAVTATLLSGTGIAAFAAFLWVRTGTPFASLIAQRDGWQEKSDPLALVHLANRLRAELSLSHFNHPTINLNLVAGFLGAILLVYLLILLFRSHPPSSLPAVVWTLGISLLAVTSEYVPPNPRLLITAFPAVVVVGHRVRGRRWAAVAWLTAVLLAGLSALTFVGPTLRP